MCIVVAVRLRCCRLGRTAAERQRTYHAAAQHTDSHPDHTLTHIARAHLFTHSFMGFELSTGLTLRIRVRTRLDTAARAFSREK
jgi:hypothetical protein